MVPGPGPPSCYSLDLFSVTPTLTLWLRFVYSQLVYLYPVGMFYTLCLFEVFASSLFVLALKALLMEKSVKDADFHLYITLSHI